MIANQLKKDDFYQRSRPSGEGWHEHFWRRWFVANRSMRPDRVAVTPPAFDDDLRLAQAVEDFAIEKFVAKATVPTRQLDEVGRELLFVVPAPRHLTLCRAVLPEGPADPPLGQLRHRHDVFDTSAPARRAQ